MTRNGDLVQELSFYFGTKRPREHPLYLHPRVPSPHAVEGRLGVLATRGDRNYYHFLMDVVPRLGVMASCPDIAPPSKWYVPTTSRFQRELLDLAGVPEWQRVDSDTYPHVSADVLVVPTPPSMTVINPPWVVGWLRARLLIKAVSRVAGRGLYVTRGTGVNNRTVSNEEEVVSALVASGFQAIDPAVLSVSEQIRAFAEASVVVAPHGAALANLVFASPGAGVVELFPAGAVVPDYWKLAGGVPGLEYRYLTGSGRQRVAGRSKMLVRDITVDVPELMRVVDGMLARRSE
ncbi:MAG: glycosyltransferase family 61 protein [Actinomycetota bacterium]|nr:glycosyltransferase family 61 protein [Actinomycetota bacterium]